MKDHLDQHKAASETLVKKSQQLLERAKSGDGHYLPLELKEAIEHAEKACNIRPRWPVAHIQLAQCLEKKKNRSSMEGALSHFERAVELDQELWHAHGASMDLLRELISEYYCEKVLSAETSEAIYDALIFTPSQGSHVVLAASHTSDIYAWALDSGKLVAKLKGHKDCATVLCLSHDNRLLASGSLDRTAKLWATETLFESVSNKASVEIMGYVLDLRGHENRVNSIEFTADDTKVISGSVDGTMRIWSADTGECLQKLSGHSSLISSICLSPEGQILVSASGDSDFRLWDV